MVYDTLKKALDKYGIEHQTLMLCEECGELIQASNKILRYGRNEKTVNSLVEEMADVLVMIEQMRIHYGINWIDIMNEYTSKVERLKQRMEFEDIDLDGDVSTLGLSNHIVNVLHNVGINTVKQLTKHKLDDVERFRGIGKKGIDELCRILNQYGLVWELNYEGNNQDEL